ncbi:ABC transporter ATP-binding protein [Brachybacterium sacelli]|uniref:NitT/TauT family transport system ATP-binding protein n=1 Tax=Brachybacterium sacelli TaxID=173364 RepID=A0ABS4X5D7_9MICO|nr:ABC transporter ATP-binding protein [Brachybacterium sacelli]MBP2383598.1 NitT/TauT family transport system ATP-binding protein [Brachybacterium sacelli]
MSTGTIARERPEPAPRANPAVSVRDTSVTFSSQRGTVTALSGANLEVEHGEFITIVGPSGCGKSTLLKVVSGLGDYSSGTVEINGDPISGPRQDIGFVFQRPALLEWRNVRQNIMLQAEMRGLPLGAARERCDHLIEMTGLTGFERSWPHELSGGMQQRVALCRALLHEPEILLMDEPFGALDALTRERMNVELHQIWRETGTTIMLVTHSVAEAVYLAQRVVVMSPRPGRIVEIQDVSLPAERDYAASLEAPAFHKVSHRVRELLGASTSEE